MNDNHSPREWIATERESPASAAGDRWLVRAILLAQFGPAFMFSGVAVALPAMGHELAMSATELGLVETTFLASSTAFLLPAGRVADMLRRGALFRWTLMAFGVLSLLIGCVSHAWLVLLLRFLQGLVSALASAAGPALLMDLVPPAQRGRAFGAMIGMAYLGLAAGPLAAGFVVEHLGWRSVFFVGAAWILVGGLPAFLRTAAHGERRAGRLHLPSSVLVVVGMCAVVAALAVSGHGGVTWPWLALAVAALGAFVAWQPRLREPLLDLREMWHNATLAGALAVQVLLYLNAYCSIFLLSLFLQVGKGLEARTAGLWLMTGSVVMACIAPSAGRLADRVKPQIVASCGVLGVLVSSALGFTLAADVPPWRVGLVLAAQGLGFGLFSSPNMALILGSLPRERSGFASALAAQSRGLGMFSGMAVTSALVAAHFGERPVAADPAGVVATVHDAYGVLLVTSALALGAAFVRRRR